MNLKPRTVGELDRAAAPPRLQARGLRSSLAGPFDIVLGAGQCIAVTGRSGSGKSLMLRMVADLDPSEGEVRLDGALRETFPPTTWRRRLAYVPAESGWWAEHVQDHFDPPALARAKNLADRLGVDRDLFEASVDRLSSGERHRLALIRAVAPGPRVLLLDEPTGPLDPESVGRVEALLAERLATGISILLVTHDSLQAETLGAVRFKMVDRRLVPLV
jgi:ABC-type iron transport system FetAB ATPase subunit